jgi:monoamine oxidase
MTLDASPESGAGVLAVFAFGPRGFDLGRLAPERRREIVLETLAKRLGPRATTPLDYIEQDWYSEVWSKGCYMAHFPPGVMTQSGRVLREPCGRVHWAGTETATTSHGSIDGAIRSGDRAADEVLARL